MTSVAPKISKIGDVNEDLSPILCEIVPFLPSIADVVALYSCSSPVRDATAASMLEHLASQHWGNHRHLQTSASISSNNNTAKQLRIAFNGNNLDNASNNNNTNNNTSALSIQSASAITRATISGTCPWSVKFNDYSIHAERTKDDEEVEEKMRAISSADMIRHVIFHGARSATSCSKIKVVDVSIRSLFCKSSDYCYNSSKSQPMMKNAIDVDCDDDGDHDDYGDNDNFLTDDELVCICKWCPNLEVLIADGHSPRDSSISRSSGISEFGLYSACVCLARNENFKRISLRSIPLEDLKGLALVTTLESVDCSLNSTLSPSGVAPLASLAKLTEVTLVRCAVLGSVDGLADSPSITRVDISACPISSIAKLATNLKTLRWLKADATRIENGISSLRYSTSLDWISLRNVRAPQEELEALSDIPTLKHLCVYNAKVEAVDFLENFTNIESLDIGMLQVKRADFTRNGEGTMPRLTRLCMRYCPVVETIYMQKQWGRTLLVLDLMNASLLADEGLEFLGEGLPNLVSLNLAGTAVSDITVDNEICLLAKLQYLDLSNTAVTSVSSLVPRSSDEQGGNDCEPSTAPLLGCPELRTLKLECCRSFPALGRGGGMKGIGNLDKLEELHIGCTNLRDLSRGGSIFEPWKSLKILNCSGLLWPPKEFVTFCLQCRSLRKLVLATRHDTGKVDADEREGNSQHHLAITVGSAWREVAETIRSHRYVEIVGLLR